MLRLRLRLSLRGDHQGIPQRLGLGLGGLVLRRGCECEALFGLGVPLINCSPSAGPSPSPKPSLRYALMVTS